MDRTFTISGKQMILQQKFKHKKKQKRMHRNFRSICSHVVSLLYPTVVIMKQLFNIRKITFVRTIEMHISLYLLCRNQKLDFNVRKDSNLWTGDTLMGYTIAVLLHYLYEFFYLYEEMFIRSQGSHEYKSSTYVLKYKKEKEKRKKISKYSFKYFIEK